MFLGPEGHPVVREMAVSTSVFSDIRTKALRHLLAGYDRREMIELATSLLGDRYNTVQRMAVQCLGRLRYAPALDSLLSILKTADVATQLEVLKAIESIGEPSAEGPLLLLLAEAPDRVKTAAVEALGALGTIRAVEPLHILAERGKFKRTARRAIASIQSRLGNVEAGRLSLASTVDPAGALSIAGDPGKAGGLSLDKNSEKGDPTRPPN